MTDKEKIALKDYMDFRFDTLDKRICESIQSMKDAMIICQGNTHGKFDVCNTRLNTHSDKIRDIEIESSKNKGVFTSIATIGNLIWLGILTFLRSGQ